MRERVTYILRSPNSDFNPSQLTVTSTNFAVNGLEAYKEDYLTFAYDQIPQVLWRILRNCHEFHIRWSSTFPYQPAPPFVSRVTPGLHVSYTPLQGRSGKRLCEVLKAAFGQALKCDKTETAFSTPNVISTRFASGASREYFSFVHSLQQLSFFIQKEICGEEERSIPCRLRAHDLIKADLLDVDYDAVSQALVVKAMWTNPNGDDGKWYETLMKGPKEEDTLEVGVLMSEEALEEEELRFSGFLTKVGQDNKPGATLFSTPSRHHPLHYLTYRTSFSSPTGLHPVLTLSFLSTPIPPSSNCALHAHFTLPSTLFLDRYPFTDPLFLASHHLAALRAFSGATDLEAPEWTTPTWGSAALFELAAPDSDANTKAGAFNVTIPLHLRYLAPANFSTILLPVPWPVVFFACPAEQGSKFSTSPFDRVNLGYDGLFGSNTVFYHVRPAQEGVNRMVETLAVPVLDLRKAGLVELGTTVAVVMGAVWVLWELMRGIWRRGVARKTKTA